MCMCIYIYVHLYMYICIFIDIIKMKSHAIGFAEKEFEIITNIYNVANILLKMKFKWFTT